MANRSPLKYLSYWKLISTHTTSFRFPSRNLTKIMKGLFCLVILVIFSRLKCQGFPLNRFTTGVFSEVGPLSAGCEVCRIYWLHFICDSTDSLTGDSMRPILLLLLLDPSLARPGAQSPGAGDIRENDSSLQERSLHQISSSLTTFLSLLEERLLSSFSSTSTSDSDMGFWSYTLEQVLEVRAVLWHQNKMNA